MEVVKSGAGLEQMNAIRKAQATLVTQGVVLILAQIEQREDSMRLTGELVGALLAIIVLFAIFSAPRHPGQFPGKRTRHRRKRPHRSRTR